MQKKILISSIIILITVILVAFGANFLYKYDQNKKLYTFINSHPITQEVTQGLAETNEKVLKKVIANLTDLDLPPDEFIPYTDDSVEIKFSIPYNKKWGGNNNTLEVFEKKNGGISFGNGLVYYDNGGETPVFRRNFEFSETFSETYRQEKNMPDNSECPKAEEVMIGENIFLKKQVCGLPGGTEYLLADINAEYIFTNRGQDNDVFTKFLESVKHTDGTPFKVVLLANLVKMTGNVSFNHQDKDVKLSFTYPKRWGKPDTQFDDSPLNWTEISTQNQLSFGEQEKRATIEEGSKYFSFSGNGHLQVICPFIQDAEGYECAVEISVTPYSAKKFLELTCRNGDCWIDEDLFELKKIVEKNANLSIDGYQARVRDDFGDVMFLPSRTIEFFTPEYFVKITLTYYFSQTYDEKKIESTEQIFERSEYGEQLKSLLQEFMDMVDSFKIE